MTLDEITAAGIDPALKLLPARMDSPEARVMLLTIGLQESRFEYRWQVLDRARPNLKGPARGFWEMERGTKASRGGVCGVVLHDASRALSKALCRARGCPFSGWAIWHAIETDDVLAAGFARLLLFTDPRPLPAVDDATAAWDYYVRCWRPGAVERSKDEAARLFKKWLGYHLAAKVFVTNQEAA